MGRRCLTLLICLSLLWGCGDSSDTGKTDPGETKNRIDDELPEIELLRPHLDMVLPQFEQARDRALAQYRDSGLGGVDPVVEDRLRDLGYIE